MSKRRRRAENPALRDGPVTGVLVIEPGAPGVQVEELSARSAAQAYEMLSAVASAHPESRIELSVRDEPDGLGLDEVAGAAGFELVYRQVRVGRSLTGVTRPPTRPFTFRRFREVGRRGLLLMLVGVWDGNLGPHGVSPDLELERLLDAARPAAGGPSDTSLWRVAYHAGDPAGVALVNDNGVGTGTLGYIGLLPELRGRGLGRALHAEALWLMRSSGLERYEDATGYDNAPMRAIFAGAECEPIGSAALYARHREPGDRAGGPVVSSTELRRGLLGPHVSLLRKVPCRSGGSPGRVQGRTMIMVQ
jgi:GNAT superfamily N-acetyltransferase